MAGEKFIQMLQSDKLEAVLSACRALAGLAGQSDNGRAKLRVGGLCPVLDGLLVDASEDIRLASSTAIRHMALDSQVPCRGLGMRLYLLLEFGIFFWIASPKRHASAARSLTPRSARCLITQCAAVTVFVRKAVWIEIA